MINVSGSPAPPPRHARAAWFALVAVGGVALAVVTPAFFLGNASGHDFEFHISSWMDVARQWSEGVVYPRWAARANYGFGEPRFIFYPPASWLLGAALGKVLGWRAAPGAFIWLALTLAGAAMYRLAREWLPAGDAATAAVLYTANPYNLVVVYMRSDFSELLAGALFPLLVLGAARGRAWLALVLAAVWLTNTPSGVIASYSLALLLIVFALQRRSLRGLLTGAGWMLMGFILAGFYIVPAAYEQRWVNIAEVLSSGLRPEQNSLFTSIHDPEHNLFNLIVSTIATLTITLTGLAAVAANRSGRKAHEPWWALLALAAIGVALMLPFSLPAWQWLPELRFLQFPWRWLQALALAFAYFLAAAIAEARARMAWKLLLGATLIAVAAGLIQFGWWDSEDVPVMEAAFAREAGYEGTDEYNARGADHYDLPANAPRVAILSADEETQRGDALSHVHIEKWRAEEKLFTVDAPQPVLARLRLLSYPAWRVEVNGQAAQAESDPQTAQMGIALPAGHSRVHIRFGSTPDRAIGAALSGFGACAWLALTLARRRRASALRVSAENV